MWSNRVHSESPHLCGHFDTKIEEATIENIRGIFFSTLLTQSVLQLVESLIQATTVFVSPGCICAAMLHLCQPICICFVNLYLFCQFVLFVSPCYISVAMLYLYRHVVFV